MGKPFAHHGRGPHEYDCWGLAVAICRDEFGVALPDYGEAYNSAFDRLAIAAKMETEKRAGLFEEVHEATAGTIILLRLQGRPWHCAIAVDRRWMLHVVSGANVVLERMDSWVWRNHIEGMYRHV
jgi:probable lipoprotein NlpC